MNFIFGFIKKYPLVRFLVTGGLNTLVCLALFWVLIKIHINYIVASTIMFAFGIVEGYILSAWLVFKTKIQLSHLLKYSLIYILSYSLNIAILFICVEFMGIEKLASQTITSLIVAFVNYYLVKKLIF